MNPFENIRLGDLLRYFVAGVVVCSAWVLLERMQFQSTPQATMSTAKAVTTGSGHAELKFSKGIPTTVVARATGTGDTTVDISQEAQAITARTNLIEMLQADVGTFFVCSFVVGVMLYATSRAFVFPLFYRQVLRGVWSSNRTEYESVAWCKALADISPCPWTQMRAEFELDRRRIEGQKEGLAGFDEWGSQVHFLYAVALGLLCSVFVAPGTSIGFIGSGVFSLLFLVAGGLTASHHIRYSLYLRDALTVLPHGT